MMVMALSGGPLGGVQVEIDPNVGFVELECGDARNRRARYELRTLEETGETIAVFVGFVLGGV